MKTIDEEIPEIPEIGAEESGSRDPESMKQRMGFRTAEQSCGNCAHHKDGMCEKGGFPCEESDTCQEFTMSGEEVSDYDTETEEEEIPELA